MVNHRRTELEIIQHILNISQDGAKKTEILYKNNMSYTQLTEYLDFLLEKNIIKETIYDIGKGKKNVKLYIATKKGESLLKQINSIMDYLG